MSRLGFAFNFRLKSLGILLFIALLTEVPDLHSLCVRNVASEQLVWQVSRDSEELPALCLDDGRVQDTGLTRVCGMMAFFVGDLERARSYLSAAQQWQPADSMTAYWLGKAHEGLGEDAEALTAMYRAGNHRYLPANFTRLSDQEAVALAQSLKGRAVSAYAWSNLGERVYRLDPDLATQCFESAFRAAPMELSYSLGTAWFYYNEKDFAKAQLFGARARLSYPDSAGVGVFWGTLYHVLGDEDAAVAELEHVVRNFPNSNDASDAYIELSKIAIASEAYARAIAYLQAADKIQHQPFLVALLLSQAYAGMGNCEEAQAQLGVAQSLVTEQRRPLYRHFEGLIGKECPLP